MKREQPWIGFVHVQPKGDVNALGGSFKGAFTHVLALAYDSEAYKDRARTALEAEDLHVVEFSDIAPVSEYRKDGRVSVEMEALICSLSAEYPVQFDTFDAYREYDA
ncbi:MAG TPA: hypothetical protein VFQ67_17150 [Allosphingosinicella sp.]|jgi:hypothetical protein|nr:hypothetical protein [Allosphingosinicella sp.]